MNKKGKQVVIIIAGIVFVIAFVAGSVVYIIKEKEPKVQYLNASWTYAYSGVEEMTGDSDLIALVKITGLDRIKDGEVPGSYFKAEITEAVKGCNDGEEIVLYMTGIKNEEKWIEIQDDPLVQSGESYLIFARKNTTGTYTVLGGPQGRFCYEDEKLTAQTYRNQQKGAEVQVMNAESQNGISDFRQIHDQNANQMIAEIKAYINE